MSNKTLIKVNEEKPIIQDIFRANGFGRGIALSSDSPPNPSDEGEKEAFPKECSQSLKAACPDPDTGFHPLTNYQIHRMVSAVMKTLKELCSKRGASLDLDYWKNYTKVILEQKSSDLALVISTQAGAGKSTWILAFLLTLKELFQEELFSRSVVGVAVVLQKVEDLNSLASVLNEGCPRDKPFMVALQGWNKSGKKLGFCLNSSVTSYDECPRPRTSCPYSQRCPILEFHDKAPLAPVVGLTQERFNMLRQTGLNPLLQRICDDNRFHPRRYIIFDEKFKMASINTLSIETINDASSQFTNLISQLNTTDSNVRSLQQQLTYCVLRPYQEIRKMLRTKDDSGYRDLPFGFVTLPEELEEHQKAYNDFRDLITIKKRKYSSQYSAQIFSVMNQFYAGEPCLFSKTNGFSMHHIEPPQIHFGSCQTIIFDATAEVDGDYRELDNILLLTDRPHSAKRSITYFVHTHKDLNVSKSAMAHSWKLPVFTRYIADIVSLRDCKVFLCTYKDLSIPLATELKKFLDRKDYDKILLMPDRDVDTIPFYFGTNGDNRFREAETVILLGYPRLNPQSYLTATCAAFGSDCIKREFELLSDEQLLEPQFNLMALPPIQDYVTHHLAARLEQEIYRSAQRNPAFTGTLHIHLFCPAKPVLDILTQRIPGAVIYDRDVPDYVDEYRLSSRHYGNGSTSRARLLQFLDTWSGSQIRVSDLRTQLDISPAVWKDLIGDPQIKKKLEQMNVIRSGRGINTIWTLPSGQCA